MDVATARGIAHSSHLQQQDRFGRPLIEHIERVAAGVPVEAQTLALLHDVLEWTGTDLQQLRAAGLTAFEERVMDLLTRRHGESFELHALRVATAQGEEGRVARVVRLADLDDHLAVRNTRAQTPPYAWARRRIAVLHEQVGAR